GHAMAEPLLKVKNLKKYFPIRGGLFSREVARVHAVDDVSFDVMPGETLGLVGESGCGKSTTGRSILRLIEPTSGEVSFEGKNVTTLDKRSLRALRKEMQIIFQDPYASLNPRMTVGSIIGEALVIHKLAPNRRAREERVIQLLETVGPSADHLRRYPHESPGAQRGADPRPDGEAQAHHSRGRRAEPDQPALGLPLPHALCAAGAVLLDQRPGAQGGLAGALGRVPGTHRRRDRVAS